MPQNGAEGGIDMSGVDVNAITEAERNMRDELRQAALEVAGYKTLSPERKDVVYAGINKTLNTIQTANL